MKWILISLVFFGQSAFSWELRQVIMSEKPSESALVITHKGERIFFQRCQLLKDQLEPSVNLSDCKFIGTTEGYTKLQLEKRIVQLEKMSSKRNWIKGFYILAGAGIGFVAGASVGQLWSMQFYKANLYAAITHVGFGAVIGTAAGTIITTQSRNFISDLIQGANPDYALQILRSNSNQVLKLKTSVSQLDRDLNFALMGIK